MIEHWHFRTRTTPVRPLCVLLLTIIANLKPLVLALPNENTTVCERWLAPPRPPGGRAAAPTPPPPAGLGRRRGCRARRGGSVRWRAAPRPTSNTAGRSARPDVWGGGADSAVERTHLYAALAPRLWAVVEHIHQAPMQRCTGGERQITDKEAPRFLTTPLQSPGIHVSSSKMQVGLKMRFQHSRQADSNSGSSSNLPHVYKEVCTDFDTH